MARTIKHLTIREEPKAGNAQASLRNFVWNGNCGCGKSAQRITKNDGSEYWCCFYGMGDGAQCSLKYRPVDVALANSINSSQGKNWPQ